MRFNYHEPKTVKDAISLLEMYGDKAKAMAGGTDLMMQMKNKTLVPEEVVDITYIPRLDYIDHDEKQGLRIGALTTIQALEESTLLQKRYSIISQAAGQLGSFAIRNMATIGGNLCNAAPSAETAPALIALGAKARIRASGSERTVPLEEFFTGPGSTVLRKGELLLEILVPALAPSLRGQYLKHSIRGSMDLAIVGVAVAMDLSPSRVCREARIVLGAVGPTPLRAQKAEATLKDTRITPSLIERSAELAMEEARPISDVRASARYRKEMIGILTSRVIKEVAGI